MYQQNTAIDLFAGCGGFTEGAEQAGLKVVFAANHWTCAVEYHAKNHPHTEHSCQDLRQADFTRVPDHDFLLASPACQGHSKARGKDRPHHDACRSTAWAVFEAAYAKEPKYIIVENVLDIQRWGTKEKRGIFYQRWLENFKDLGYDITENVINAATLGVPQERTRLFIVMVHKKTKVGPIEVPNGNRKPVPVANIIDWKADGWSKVFKPGRAERTLEQYRKGLVSYGKNFLLEYYGKGRPRSLNRPIGTITTKDRYALVDGHWMRMLTKREYLAAQGFPKCYQIPDDHDDAVKMIGNAVPPRAARHVIETVQNAIAA